MPVHLEELQRVIASMEEEVSWLAQNQSDASNLETDYTKSHQPTFYIRVWTFVWGNTSKSVQSHLDIFGYLPSGTHSVP